MLLLCARPPTLLQAGFAAAEESSPKQSSASLSSTIGPARTDDAERKSSERRNSHACGTERRNSIACARSAVATAAAHCRRRSQSVPDIAQDLAKLLVAQHKQAGAKTDRRRKAGLDGGGRKTTQEYHDERYAPSQQRSPKKTSLDAAQSFSVAKYVELAKMDRAGRGEAAPRDGRRPSERVSSYGELVQERARRLEAKLAIAVPRDDGQAAQSTGPPVANGQSAGELEVAETAQEVPLESACASNEVMATELRAEMAELRRMTEQLFSKVLTHVETHSAM